LPAGSLPGFSLASFEVDFGSLAWPPLLLELLLFELL